MLTEQSRDLSISPSSLPWKKSTYPHLETSPAPVVLWCPRSLRQILTLGGLRKKKKRKKGDFPIRLVIQSYSSLSVFWMRPGQFSRPFIVSFMRMSHPVRKKKVKVQNCTRVLNGPSHHNYVVDSGEHIGPELKLRNYQGSHQNITNTNTRDETKDDEKSRYIIPNSTSKSL
jgi:hypothetical protein